MGFGRGLLLWILGIPLPIIILLALFGTSTEWRRAASRFVSDVLRQRARCLVETNVPPAGR